MMKFLALCVGILLALSVAAWAEERGEHRDRDWERGHDHRDFGHELLERAVPRPQPQRYWYCDPYGRCYWAYR